MNLDDVRLIDYLVAWSEKIYIGRRGSRNKSLQKCRRSGGVLFKLKDYNSLKEEGVLRHFLADQCEGLLFLMLDLNHFQKMSSGIGIGVNNDRNEQWGRFNTINRADATRA